MIGCTSFLGASLAAQKSPMGEQLVHRASFSSRHGKPDRSFPIIEAKRSNKKKQARKIERREDMRSFQAQRIENAERAKAAAAAAKQRKTPPPESMEAALQRVDQSDDKINDAAIQLKTLKQEARDSENFMQEIGFKAFPEVQEAMLELQRCKAEGTEARLEAALYKLGTVSGKPRFLDSFNWTFGADMSENLDCCGYILNNCAKFKAEEPAQDILRILEVNGLSEKLDPKATSWLLAMADVSDT